MTETMLKDIKETLKDLSVAMDAAKKVLATDDDSYISVALDYAADKAKAFYEIVRERNSV